MLSRIFLFVLFLGSTSVFAGDKVMLKYEFAVPFCRAYPARCEASPNAAVRPSTYYRMDATLSVDEFVVKSKLSTKGSKATTSKLSLKNRKGMLFLKYYNELRSVKVREQTKGAVCSLATSPEMYIDTLSVADTKGKLRKVLGPEGCYISHEITPETNIEDARALKAAVRELAVSLAFPSL